MKRAAVKAVFFDVDFTLIYPGPTFQGVGFEQFCARYGMSVDIDRFGDAVRAASSVLEQEHDQLQIPPSSYATRAQSSRGWVAGATGSFLCRRDLRRVGRLSALLAV